MRLSSPLLFLLAWREESATLSVAMASILAVLTDIFDNFLLGEEGTLGTIAKRETAGMRHYKVKVSLWLNFISMSLPPSKYSKGMSMAALLERVLLLFLKEDFGEKSVGALSLHFINHGITVVVRNFIIMTLCSFIPMSRSKTFSDLL